MGPRFRAKSITFRPSKGESVHLHSSSRVTRTSGAGPLSPLLSSFPSHPACYLRETVRDDQGQVRCPGMMISNWLFQIREFCI